MKQWHAAQAFSEMETLHVTWGPWVSNKNGGRGEDLSIHLLTSRSGFECAMLGKTSYSEGLNIIRIYAKLWEVDQNVLRYDVESVTGTRKEKGQWLCRGEDRENRVRGQYSDSGMD